MRCATTPIEPTGGVFLAVSTHFESACTPEHRARQVAGLIEALDTEFPGLPVLIGGDLNTGHHNGSEWRAEGPFDIARAAGFEAHGGPEDTPTIRPSLIARFPERAMKLDWFLSRGLTLETVEIRPSPGPGGTPLSDHDAMVACVQAIGQALSGSSSRRPPPASSRCRRWRRRLPGRGSRGRFLPGGRGGP